MKHNPFSKIAVKFVRKYTKVARVYGATRKAALRQNLNQLAAILKKKTQ